MTNKMAKLSASDKMRIQTLREQGYGAKAICKLYPDKCWTLSTVKKICKRVDERGSATERKVGSGRPRTARTAENINAVDELLCSQENQPGTSKSTSDSSHVSELKVATSSICLNS
jgi:transposase